jgi:hypothetical protein
VSTAEVAKRYFAALAARDVDSAVAYVLAVHADPVTGDVAGALARAAEG